MVYGVHKTDDDPVVSSASTIHQNHPNDVRYNVDVIDPSMAGLWGPNDEQLPGQFADCEDSPREVDLLTEEHIEELLDAVDCLRGRVEQLQIHCDKLSYEKTQMEERLIDQERAGQARMNQYEHEINELRKLNTQLAAQQNNCEGGSTSTPVWLKTALDAERALEEKTEAENKVKDLQITVMEKDKLISSLEWQLLDMESTVTSLQAERDRLAVELDCMLEREQDDLEAYGVDVGDEKVLFSDEEDQLDHQSTHASKLPQRHLSDLSSREGDRVEQLSSGLKHNARGSTVSDLDMPSSGGFGGLGGLKRSTNYCNINDLDESADFHAGENPPRFVDSGISDLSASFPVPKKPQICSTSWQSFGSESDSESRTTPKGQNPSEIRAESEGAWVSDEQADSTLQLCASAEAFEDALDGDWVLDKDRASDGALSSNKNGSCRSSSSAYFSDSANEISQDLWSFTPDSIINVSTGEELHSPGPSTKTSRENMNIYEENCNIDQTGSAQEKKEVTSSVDEVTSSNESLTSHDMTSSSLVSPNGSVTGVNLERTISVRSDSVVDTMTKAAVNHQRMNSAPMIQHGTKKGADPNSKLTDYQKWKLGGRLGQPPSKLKISQC